MVNSDSFMNAEQPIFGVPLHLAVERHRCHDGVELPGVVRDCLDYIEENGNQFIPFTI